MIAIRPAGPSDAAAFLDLKTALDHETTLMMFEPGERTTSVEQERAALETLEDRENSTILVAEVNGELAGYVQAEGGAFRRTRHSAHIVIGVRAAFAGQGIGTRLLQTLDGWAREQGLHRLELTVQAHNDAAVALYRKLGFEIEGTRRHSLLVDGVWVDELLMAKLLDGASGQSAVEPV